MALTPEDVVTKQFQHVRFKEGFDPDEVDDFLDEIVVEWRKTIAENDELKAKLAAYESGSAPVAAAPAEVEEPAVVDEVPAAEPEPEPVAAAPTPAADATAPALATAGIIELAQRLHDEHVAEGQAQKDKLISEAELKASQIIADAEQKSREELSRLDSERSTLENRISELRQFERDYRTQLRGFIEDKLRDLDVAGTGASPVSAS
ncbi:DivIVA domain-containing protein [Microbacterium telephonicum]|uniref:Cell wall synthesis protein Wag31 n=1 Tax=Microbacterium telephonicum TaxID=1714841 RepID=A0A498C3W7_9MICO|nr:DivIVA domain-containing protein [Microbacterium telephonicum]RLK49649.1 DivIVA domain-containing protein [Microbacterium telephonicum]